MYNFKGGNKIQRALKEKRKQESGLFTNAEGRKNREQKGLEVVKHPYVLIGQIGTAFYFLFILLFIPAIGVIEKELMKTS